MKPIVLDYPEAIQAVAALEDRLDSLIRKRRSLAMSGDPEAYQIVYDAFAQTASALAMIRWCAGLEDDLAWATRKVVHDAEQRADIAAELVVRTHLVVA